MITIGMKQSLEVIKKTDFGVYMIEPGIRNDGSILLPKKEVPEGCQLGDIIEVFVYRDSDDRMICTTRQPLITMGELKKLKVVQVTKIGAFLYWGLVKDLFLPFKEQIGKVKEGQEVLVGLYVDKSNRLCATMKVSNRLRTDSPYKEGDEISGTVISSHKDYGVFLAIDDQFQGMLPAKEVVSHYTLGDTISGKVKKILEDGKITVTIKEDGFRQMEIDAENLMLAIEEAGGFLPYTDKTDVDTINKELGMSKRAFKRSVGRLMKLKKITLSDEGIRRVEKA